MLSASCYACTFISEFPAHNQLTNAKQISGLVLSRPLRAIAQLVQLQLLVRCYSQEHRRFYIYRAGVMCNKDPEKAGYLNRKLSKQFLLCSVPVCASVNSRGIMSFERILPAPAFSLPGESDMQICSSGKID